MDKLIRFINEYGHTSACGPFETCRIEPATEWYSSYLVLSRDDNGEGDWKDWHLPIPRLISKEYGFIKRLIENDKIDRPKVWLKIKDLGDNYGWFAIYSGIHIECLLMLLSISDTPIEDLVSYLK